MSGMSFLEGAFEARNISPVAKLLLIGLAKDMGQNPTVCIKGLKEAYGLASFVGLSSAMELSDPLAELQGAGMILWAESDGVVTLLTTARPQ